MNLCCATQLDHQCTLTAMPDFLMYPEGSVCLKEHETCCTLALNMLVTKTDTTLH